MATIQALRLIKALVRLGWSLDRVAGSHHILTKPGRTPVTVPVRDELETFLAGARERSEHGRGLPAFIERELRAYVACGGLARGFARVRCPDCGFERLVAFTCKAHV